MITQTEYVNMQHRIKLCSIMVNNSIINSNLKIDNDTLLEFCILHTYEIFDSNF